MTREEMIVTLKTERAVAPLHTNAEKLIEALDMALEMLQNLPRWRPLSELDSDDRVIFIDARGYVFPGYKETNMCIDEDGFIWNHEQIKGWMPEGSLDKEIFWK